MILQKRSKPDGSLLLFLSFSFLSKADPGHETAPNPHLPSCAFGQSTSAFLLLLSVPQLRGHFVLREHPSMFLFVPSFIPYLLLHSSLCYSRCLCPLLNSVCGLITLLSPHPDLSIHPSALALQLVCVTECSASAYSH